MFLARTFLQKIWANIILENHDQVEKRQAQLKISLVSEIWFSCKMEEHPT